MGGGLTLRIFLSSRFWFVLYQRLFLGKLPWGNPLDHFGNCSTSSAFPNSMLARQGGLLMLRTPKPLEVSKWPHPFWPQADNKYKANPRVRRVQLKKKVFQNTPFFSTTTEPGPKSLVLLITVKGFSMEQRALISLVSFCSLKPNTWDCV